MTRFSSLYLTYQNIFIYSTGDLIQLLAVSVFYVKNVKLFLLFFVLGLVNIAAIEVISIITLHIDFILLPGRTNLKSLYTPYCSTFYLPV